MIAENDDIRINIEKGFINVKCDDCEIHSQSIISGDRHRITIVREKNRMIKLYIDKHLDCSAYSPDSKAEIATEFYGGAEEFTVTNKATSYDEIITLKGMLSKTGRRRKKK